MISGFVFCVWYIISEIFLTVRSPKPLSLYSTLLGTGRIRSSKISDSDLLRWNKYGSNKRDSSEESLLYLECCSKSRSVLHCTRYEGLKTIRFGLFGIIRYGLKWRKNAVRPRQKTKHIFLFAAQKNKKFRLSTQLLLSDIYSDSQSNEVLLPICLAGTYPHNLHFYCTYQIYRFIPEYVVSESVKKIKTFHFVENRNTGFQALCRLPILSSFSFMI
jgi:hypothetical protein